MTTQTIPPHPADDTGPRAVFDSLLRAVGVVIAVVIAVGYLIGAA